MINEAKQVLGYISCHNYEMRRTQEREEDLRRQVEAWRKDERIRKAQEEAKELKKQA